MTPSSSSPTTTTTTSMSPPKEWPDSIVQTYEPIRVLGQGGFAAVILARVKPKSTTPTGSTPTDNNTRSPHLKAGALVAIKVASSSSGDDSGDKQIKAYWHREIDILQAISHPNIMKCLDSCIENENKNDNASSPKMAMVLSYSKGPTVESLLKHGGALSNVFGRVVIAQIVDAIAYLHSHAVVHRDLKPDNFIVTGAASNQAEIWDNVLAQDGGVVVVGVKRSEDDDSEPAPPPGDYDWWPVWRKQWHVTIVDFGFARALTPDDVATQQPSPELHRENLDASFHANHEYGLGGSAGSGNGAAVLNTSLGACSSSRGSRKSIIRRLSSSFHSDSFGGGAGGGGMDSSGRRRPFRRSNSISKQFHRKMSALGNYEFAAPEIRNKVTQDGCPDDPNDKNRENVDRDVTQTISSFVSEYGLLVDAYSLGCSIRYMMTGVLPNQSVSQAMADQSSLVEQLCGLLCRGNRKNNSTGTTTTSPISTQSTTPQNGRGPTNAPRKPHYRFVHELPGEVQLLISKMTEREESKRTSVRSARRYHWINDVLPVDEEHKEGTERIVDAKAIQYLSFKPHPA